MLDRLVLRKATPEDSELLLVWRNDPLVRSVSRDKRSIDAKAHRSWFTASLQDPNRIIWIGETASSHVGMVRVDRTSPAATQAELSILIAPESQGRGFGLALVEFAAREVGVVWPEIESLTAEVMPHNTPSMRLFERAGFSARSLTFEKRLEPKRG